MGGNPDFSAVCSEVPRRAPPHTESAREDPSIVHQQWRHVRNQRYEIIIRSSVDSRHAGKCLEDILRCATIGVRMRIERFGAELHRDRSHRFQRASPQHDQKYSFRARARLDEKCLEDTLRWAMQTPTCRQASAYVALSLTEGPLNAAH